MEAREISRNPSGTRDTKLIATPPVDLPWFTVFMVSRDHGIFGWAVAFFKESMRRDAMIGIRTGLVLRATSQFRYKSHKFHFIAEEKRELTLLVRA